MFTREVPSYAPEMWILFENSGSDNQLGIYGEMTPESRSLLNNGGTTAAFWDSLSKEFRLLSLKHKGEAAINTLLLQGWVDFGLVDLSLYQVQLATMAGARIEFPSHSRTLVELEQTGYRWVLFSGNKSLSPLKSILNPGQIWAQSRGSTGRF
ncbi:hypothetical protein [Acidithiobacillus thiooxidans]|nr:hypothetical protein [Acidithiobacillus thiooxidans]